MLERRIYEGGEYPREVHIQHGASESYVVYDSNWPKEHDSWGQPLAKEDDEFEWYPKQA